MAVEYKNIMTGVLRPDIELIRGDSLMLFDRQRELYFKVDEQTLKIVSFLTEAMPVELFVEYLRKNGIATDCRRVTEILLFLRQNDLLIPRPGEVSAKKKLQTDWTEKNRLLRFSSAYLFFRLPPWRPEHFFERIGPYVSWIASRRMMTFYAVLAFIGYILLFRNLQNAVTEFRNSLSWIGLVRYFIVIIAVKCIHEAAHSLAAIHFHCRVRGIGIGFMVFCPRFYTDTTDSWRLPRQQRTLIDSAGIVAELLLGGTAAILWYYLPPGVVHSTMFYILTVSTLSTVVINGNPFIRYDGYYILCDVTGADNLMSRSANAVRQYWRWYLLRIGTPPDFSATWKYACFGVASFAYRIFLYTSIILVIYHKFNKTIALVMIFLEIYSIGLYPLGKEIRQIYLLSKKSSRTCIFFIAGIFMLLAVLMCIPFGWNEVLPGEVTSQQKVIVAAPADGFLSRDLKLEKVKKDEILLQLNSPRLDFSLTRMQNKYLEEDLCRVFQERDSEQFAEAKLTAARQQSVQNAVRELMRQKNALTIRVPVNGFFIPVSRDFLQNKFVQKNTILGYVNSAGKMIVAYADDQQLGWLLPGQKAEIFVRGTLKKYHGIISSVSTVPATFDETLLLQPFGGPVSVYYDRHPDKKGYTTTQPWYRIEIESPESNSLIHGQTLRIYIKKRTSAAVFLMQLLRSVWNKEFSEIF